MRATLISLVTVPLLGLGLVTGPAHAQAEGEEVDGGPAAPEAAELEPGTRYVDDVRPGEARWYSIEAGQAQGLRGTLTEYGEVEYGCCLELKLHDPDYEQLAFENHNNSDGTPSSLSISQEEVDQTGTYYLEITLGEGAANRPVEYEFDLAATGEPAPGEEPTEEESATDEASPEEDAEETAAASDTDGGGNALLWVLVALLVLLVLLLAAVVVLLLVRQGRQPKASTPTQSGPPHQTQ